MNAKLKWVSRAAMLLAVLPVIALIIVAALHGGSFAVNGVILGIWFSGFVTGDLWAGVTLVQPLLDREAAVLKQTEEALEQRDEAVEQARRFLVKALQ